MFKMKKILREKCITILLFCCATKQNYIWKGKRQNLFIEERKREEEHQQQQKKQKVEILNNCNNNKEKKYKISEKRKHNANGSNATVEW